MKEDLKLLKYEFVVCVMFYMLDGEFLNIVSCLYLFMGDYEKYLFFYLRRCKVC